jgi:nicotinamide-nucleotide amidase
MTQNELTEVVTQLKDKNLTIAFAESCTAGLLVSEFVKAKGISEVLKGSLVVYQPEVKTKLLNVKKKTLELYTAESQQVTNEMVMGLHKMLKADISIAVTGLTNSGASETEEKPVGTVFVSFLYDGKAEEFREVFDGSMQDIRKKMVDFIFNILKGVLDQHFSR